MAAISPLLRRSVVYVRSNRFGIADGARRDRSLRHTVPGFTATVLVLYCFAAPFAETAREHRAGGKVDTPRWNDTSLTPDQLSSIARTLLPLGLAGCPDTLFLPPQGSFLQFAFIDRTESDPVVVTMSLRQSDSKTKVRANAFELLAGFELTSAPSLLMPPLSSSGPLLLEFPAGRYSEEVIVPPDVDNPFVPGSKMEMKIIAYPGGMGFSTIEFVNTMLDDRFDSVWKTGDLGRFGATAIRCRKRSVFRNAGGTYFAIIAFDARVTQGVRQCIIKPAAPVKSRDGPQIVRYLITLRSDSDIEEKAEYILQNVLQRFERGG